MSIKPGYRTPKDLSRYDKKRHKERMHAVIYIGVILAAFVYLFIVELSKI